MIALVLAALVSQPIATYDATGNLSSYRLRSGDVEIIGFYANGSVSFDEDFGTSGDCLTSGGSGSAPLWQTCVIGTAYQQVQDESVSLPERSAINFLGAGITCVDDTVRTNCTVSGGGGGGYDTIQDETVGLTARTTVNFTGAGISCVDNGGSSRTDCTVAGGGGGGGGDGNAGTTTCDFGAYPSDNDCTVTITGETGILAGSVVEAWIAPIATADHTVDEHILAPIRVYAHTVVAGDGFTVTAIYDPPYQQDRPDNNRSRNSPSTTVPRTYGLWSISWRWGVGPGPGVANPGGADQQVQYNNAGVFGGMVNVEHDGGNIILLEDLPSAPAAGELVPHARSEAIPLLASRINGESGTLVGLPWASADIFMWRPLTGSTMMEIGSASSVNGSPSTPTPSTGSMASRARRTRHTSVALTNQGISRYHSVQTIALETGFWIKFRLVLAAMNSDGYAFVGLTAANGTITGASPPSGFVNVIGFGKNGADANWQVITNDGAGAAVSHVNLGADFPTATTTAVVDLVLYAPAGGTTVTYWANRVDTSVTPVTGTVSTELPASDAFMTPRVYVNTGPTSGTAATFDLLFMTGFKEV